eukprot:g1608.t1
MPFVQLIAQPFWGVIADKFRNRKLVFMFTSALSTLSILSLAYDEFSDRYWKILLISAITSAFVSGGIIDAYAVDELKKRGRADDYGRLRLWAAVSWGSGNCIMGFITDKYGFSSVFYIFGGFQFFNLVLTGYFIPDRTVDEAAAIVGGKSSPPLSVLLVALTRMRVLVLLILIGVFGAGFAVVDRLLFVYLIDSFQASKLLCGLTVGMTVLFELPIFYYGKSILKTMGPQVMMAIAMVAFLIRMFGYAILTKETLNYILLLELLHGLTFAMMWTATVSIVSKISPAGWKTATMTIVQAFMYCLGGGTGSIVGGWAAQLAAWDTVTFDKPTSEPGKNVGGMPIISGGMPIGNGETTALVFPLIDPLVATGGFQLEPGVHLWIGMTTAMASDQSLMPLAVVSVVTKPPLGTEAFAQTLHLRNASVEVKTPKGSVAIWVDALTNKITVRANLAVESEVTVTLKSLRPSRRFVYGGRCYNATAAADEFMPQYDGTNSIGLSHRNMDEDLSWQNEPGFFNSTLKQQGLGAFAENLQAGDRWRHRQFGLVASGSGFVTRNSSSLVAVSTKTADVTITTLSRQTSTPEEWQTEIATMHREHLADDSAKAFASHDSFWKSFWNNSHIWVSSGNQSNAGQHDALTTRYAQNRYVQAIQAGTWVPIKFNGMTFMPQLPPDTINTGPAFREWGSSNWWQNTRLAYWNMAAAGDFSQLRTIFDYYLQMIPFLETRTAAAFNHSGLYVTETKTLFGAYDPCDYGTAAENRSESDLNFGYEESRFLKFDFGGDAGLPELCVMLLDYYAYTLDDDAMAMYMPLLTGTLDFFARHYGDVERLAASDLQLNIFPAQALETYQCPIWPATDFNCPTNDHPTVAALYVLTERAQELPLRFSTEAQRAQNADLNTGWVQGLLNAALLGRAKKAAEDTLARAQTPPAKGYRFPAFAPHEQDYEPSEDHLANMATALQLMLLSPADDGLNGGGALLFPAWPCSWDVDFKIRAPRNTTVSGKFAQGKLLELIVAPPERKAFIEVLPCQDIGDTSRLD